MESEASLGTEQRATLAQFREFTANARDVPASIALLSSCGWDIEQAVTLHLTAGDDPMPAVGHAAGSSTAAPPQRADDLGAPLLEGDGAGGDAVAAAARAPRGVFGWIVSSLRRLSVSILELLAAFIMGPAGALQTQQSGAAFQRALTNSYGQDLIWPRFHEGTFASALATARQELKLLVVYLHSDIARHSQEFVTQVLCCEGVRMMLDENFVLWGGDVARLESHQVSQMIHARGFPCLTALLPVSVEEIRVIQRVHGQVQPDAAVAMLHACMDEMGSYRAELVARQEQHSEDRQLRQDQDQEYEQALAMDRQRAEEQKKEDETRREAEREEREREEAQQAIIKRTETEKLDLESRRKKAAQKMVEEGVGEDCTARIALRLPAGQRVDRKFRPGDTLEKVYAWADCLVHLPENEAKGLVVPMKFVLKNSYPAKLLIEKDKTVQELQLAGASILCQEVEDDD